MSDDKPTYFLSRLKFRYRMLRLIEIIFLAGGTVLMTFAISSFFITGSTISVSGSLMAGLFVFGMRFRHYKLAKLTNSRLTSYLNSTYPQLQQSADLLMIHNDSLTNLARIQKQRVIDEFNRLYPEIKVPQQVGQAFGIFIACVLGYLALSSFSDSRRGDMAAVKNTKTDHRANDSTSADLEGIRLTTQPPQYTGLKTSTTTIPNLHVPEGSLVTWQIEFSNDIEHGTVNFSNLDSIDLKSESTGKYFTKRIINESGFYQVKWTDHGKPHASDYFKIEVVQDLPPKVTVDNLSQFTKLTIQDNQQISLTSSIADDYGLKDVDIVATVSKGSGESVKFREEKLRFNNPSKIVGRKVQASTVLDLKKLGLEPGDEIYFYVEAFDNKEPVPNRNRTETFFIALADTTKEITTTDDGLGVDLMPEYFRSQRQIIIDTEKLLRERKKLTKHEFNSTSNELGYDEKVLRLRYGQFMGEEAESGIAQIISPQQEEEEDETDPAKKYGHAHDTKNEHNLIEDKKAKQDSHDHGEVKDPNAKEDPLDAFIHKHDDTEEATFFIQSVKAKLKAALSIMWDAELYLRLYEPAKSLPYQYKVLNLLKEISNDSRIYVHRTGFDPAPLKEERRLTADLSEIRNFTGRHTSEDAGEFRNIREAITVTEYLLSTPQAKMTSSQRQILKLAGQELAAFAIENPAAHMKGLSLLKILSEKDLPADEMQLALQGVLSALWNALPEDIIGPAAKPAQPHRLDAAFIKQLDATKK